jgi:hypothetical protein
MATLNDVIVQDVSDVFMSTEDFAGTVVHLAGGDTNTRTQVTAVVALRDAMLEKGRGRGVRTMGDIVLPATVSVHPDDAFEINGLRFEVVAVTPAEGGASAVTISRYATQHRGGRTAGDI